MNWKKWGRVVKGDGSSKVIYHSDKGYKIESRKNQIPHSGRAGFWMHTSYFLIRPDGSEKEYHSLADAKEAAEHG